MEGDTRYYILLTIGVEGDTRYYILLTIGVEGDTRYYYSPLGWRVTPGIIYYSPLGWMVTAGIECIPGSATYFMSTGISLKITHTITTKNSALSPHPTIPLS